MNPNSEPSSNDKIPSFFLDDDKTGKNNLDFQNIDDETDTNETLSNTHTTKAPRITSGIHWPSLVIGAGIAVACIFCGVLMVNMINSETTPVLDETPQKQTEIAKKQSLSIFTDNASPILGNPNAPITMVEFGDYQCTFCYKFHDDTMEKIYEKYVKNGDVNFIYKDFPLNGEASILASEASYCAQQQGQFWEYHNLIYDNWAGENTGWITNKVLAGFAKDLGLNLEKFNLCMDNSIFQDLIPSLLQIPPTLCLLSIRYSLLPNYHRSNYDTPKTDLAVVRNMMLQMPRLMLLRLMESLCR
jgi:hypothetical protein